MEIAWVALIVWGGLCAVDATSFGQFMISRPLAACLVAAWIMGAPAEALVLALVLEAAHLGVLPVGASRYPEGGPAAAAAGAVVALTPPSYSALLTAIVFALTWESVSGRTIEWIRNLNGGFVARAPLAEQPRRHLAAIGVDFARGALLTAAAAALLLMLMRWTLPTPPSPADDAVARVLVVGALVMLLAASVRLFGDRFRPWAAGLIAGALLLVVG